jgi:hypothetical protein
MDLINGDEKLYKEISALIEENRRKIYAHANASTILSVAA